MYRKSKIFVTGKTVAITKSQIYFIAEKNRIIKISGNLTENVDTNTDIKRIIAMVLTGRTNQYNICKNKKINIKSKIRLLRATTMSTVL